MFLIWTCEFLAFAELQELTSSMREEEWRLVLYFIFSEDILYKTRTILYDIEIFPTALVEEAILVSETFILFTFFGIFFASNSLL